MANFELVTATDVQLMQGLAQRVSAIRLDLVNSDASFGELAWIWGKGHASEGASWRRRLWFADRELVAWGWAVLPHRLRRSDGSMKDVTGAYLAYLVHPDHAGLVDEVIDWYDATAAELERTVRPSAADAFALQRWAAHGYATDPAALGDAGSWTQLNQRDLTEVDQPEARVLRGCGRWFDGRGVVDDEPQHPLAVRQRPGFQCHHASGRKRAAPRIRQASANATVTCHGSTGFLPMWSITGLANPNTETIESASAA